MADPSPQPKADSPAQSATMADPAGSLPSPSDHNNPDLRSPTMISPTSHKKLSPKQSPNKRKGENATSPTGSNDSRPSSAGKDNEAHSRPSMYGSSKINDTKQTFDNDPAKQKEREERVRIARERQAMERQRKLEEIREAQRRAQEFRDKQQEERRRKIMEMRRRDEQHRTLIEERRKRILDEENERRQAIIRKSMERDAKLDTIRSGSKRGSSAHQSTPPLMRRPRSSLSDHTLSSSDGSPVRKPRPHSIAGRFPGYACPTVSSQARTGRSPEKKMTASSTSIKGRSKSADTGLRRSRADLQKTLDRLSAPKTIPKETRESARTSPQKPQKPTPQKSTPTKPQPTVPRVVPRELPTKPTASSANKMVVPSPTKNVTPTKGPVRAVHALKASAKKVKSPSPKEGSPVKERSPPPAVPSPSVKEKAQAEEEAKAKLAERRRLAREKAEREAEEERLKQEELRRQEEQRQREEEEAQRRFEEEQQRLMDEAKKAEEERLRKAIEEEERRKEEEAARLEEERLAKEEADRKAREEAEKKELERLEKKKKEEEERLARKKRLEMIMKRVKTDDSTPKESLSPSKTAVTPTDNDSEEVKVETPGEDKQTTEPAPQISEAERNDGPPAPQAAEIVTPAAPVQLTLTSEDSDGKPKFKSPLLQQMLGKGRTGSGIKLSASSERLQQMVAKEPEPKEAEVKVNGSSLDSREEEDTTKEEADSGVGDATSPGESSTDSCSDTSRAQDEDKDIDTAESCLHVAGQMDGSAENLAEGSEITLQTETLHHVVTPSIQNGAQQSDLLSTEASNGLDMSSNNMSAMNGVNLMELDMDVDNAALLDASVSMKLQAQSGLSQGLASELQQTQQLTSSNEAEQVEEFITLDNQPPVAIDTSLLNMNADLINSNNMNEEPPRTTPLIAFEENSPAVKQENAQEIMSS